MLIPVGTEHFEAPYLGSAADMTTYTWTDVVIADPHKADGVGSIFRQTTRINLLGQFVTRHKLEGDRQILINQFLHAALDLLFFLARGFVIEVEAHLALFTLDMGIV